MNIGDILILSLQQMQCTEMQTSKTQTTQIGNRLYKKEHFQDVHPKLIKHIGWLYINCAAVQTFLK